FLLLRRPTRCTLFPYTTLFRSQVRVLLYCFGEFEIELIGHVVLQHVQDKPFFNRLAHRVQMEGLWLTILVFVPKHLQGFIFWSRDRKSTRLNSSHVKISYAVFC